MGFGLSGFETGRNLRYEAKSVPRANLKKRTQRLGYGLSRCRPVSRLHAIYDSNPNRAGEPI